MPNVANLKELARYAVGFVESHPHGVVAGLSGDLGAGKTAFVRAVAQVLADRRGVKLPRLTSPTFVFHQSYAELGLEHFDLYRLDRAGESELLNLGYFEIRQGADSKGTYLFVEWPERATPTELLGLEVLVTLKATGPTSRDLQVQSLPNGYSFPPVN